MLHKKPYHDWNDWNSSMAALLILGGMVLCLLGWLWLWQRTAREHWVWALTGVLPPLALLSGLINGRVALLPLLVFVSGLGILAGGLWQLGQTQPQQLERLLQGHWKELADSDADVLQGQVQGQAFLPDQVSFRRGILVLRQGQDFIASKEVRLDLSAYGATLLDEHLKLDILPTDSGDLPLVEVFWQDARTGQRSEERRVGKACGSRWSAWTLTEGMR